MSYAWRLTDQKINKECRTLFVEYKDEALYINNEKISIDNRKIVLILDFFVTPIKVFIFQKIPIEWIFFQKQQIRIVLGIGKRKEEDHLKIINNYYNGFFHDFILNQNTIKEPPQAIPLTETANYELTEHYIELNFCKIDSVSFEKGEYKNKINFSQNTFLNYFGIQNMNFLEKISFNGNTFLKKFWIHDSVFNGDFLLRMWEGQTVDEIDFINLDFRGDVFLFSSIFKIFRIENSTFMKKVYFGTDKPCKGSNSYGNSCFKHLRIDNCEFKDKVFYEYCDIKLFNLESTNFQSDVFFDYANLDMTHIVKTLFNQRLSFYQTEFKQPPFFTNCVIGTYLSMTGSKLDFDDEKFLKSINEQTKILLDIYQTKPSPNSKPWKEKNKEDLLKDFRDGFCNMKNILIKNNNFLDASNYHRVELYCKENELDSKKPKMFSKDWIEKWQLYFYRHTSDHHTDTLKSFHTLIALIGIFGLLCGVVILGLDYFVFDYKEGINMLNLKETYSDNIEASIKNHALGYFLGNLALVVVFIGLFLGVVWECSRKLLVPLGYVVVVMFFAISPKYLIPAMSFFDSQKALLDPICTLGGLYTLLFGFLAYSFIKTIRKNSIIPS